MADYKSLIRIRKWELDEQRRQLGELNTALNRILLEQQRVAEALQREQLAVANATAEFVAANALANFTERTLDTQRQLARAVEVLEQQITEKAEDIRLAYQEMKKFELAQEELDAAEAAEQRRRETIELDDIAIEAHARNSEN